MARTVFGDGVFDGQPAPEACLQMCSADRLRAFRMRHSVSQTRAAALINTPMRTWVGWEAQAREPPLCLWVLLDYIDRFGPLTATANGHRLVGSDAEAIVEEAQQMQSKKYDVTYHAQVQVDRLSKEEKEQLVAMFTGPTLLKRQELAPSGNSVSQLGSSSKRVVWKLSESGKPIVLSVVELEHG
jgi:hypothetical protein